MWRSFAATDQDKWFGSKVHILNASNWADPSTYVVQHKNIFPTITNPTGFGGIEDPFLYISSDGLFHAVLHNMYGCGTGIGSRPCGTHAFSVDGQTWTHTGSGAYQADIELVDGSVFMSHSRERPHLVIGTGSGAEAGDPRFLVTGAGYDRDASFTVVQDLRDHTIAIV
eukprot:TRINITY_DN29596_c0_g1_i1.p1 TRINITY_DN29596_c0_g1~~TRINITY_DN29596_c0_g1_i1.p1  ORF type:complete len:194 (+),score=17.21 TRINITY_DN29596_c0_g1_i1:77-583(+)